MGMILFVIYLIGIPISFWLMGGLEDFKPDEDEDGTEDDSMYYRDYSAKSDRYLSICITFMMSLGWPIFWVFCIGLALFSKFFGLS